MKYKIAFFVLTVLGFGLSTASARTQTPPKQNKYQSFGETISSNRRTAEASQTNREILLGEISKKIVNNYVSAEAAAEIATLINSAAKSGKFNNLSDEDFAAALTVYLRSVSKDKHFYVKYLIDFRPENNETNNRKQKKLDNISNSLENFGFEEVRRLAGNVGYINFKGFAEPKSSEVALASAMNFVSNTNSLIIDLRDNRGGDNGMLLQFCSYFLNSKTNIYQTYFRNTGINKKNWTQAKVKGQKYLSKNIYLLTSGNTFSAAEGMAFILQNYKLAKVIGEQTGGAANPIDPFIIDNKYLLLIPVGKVTVTSTKTNWEQIGVTPDEKIKAENALTKAHILALKDILKNRTRTELTETDIRETIKKLESKL
jgi:hypothetical protein